jgi:AcrR family transcriptional regulator
VSDMQRARIMDAMTDVVTERGVAGASVECVCARARVSRRTFYACFADVDECVVAVMVEALVRLGGLASRALEQEQNWLDGVRAALAEVLLFLDREPAVARVCVVESLGGSAVVREQRERLVCAFRTLIVEHIEHQAPGISPVMADGVMASVLGAIHAHIVTGQPGPLIDLHGGSMGLIAALYAGAGELDRELERTAALTRAMLAPDPPASMNPSARARVQVPVVLLRPGAFRLRECLLYIAHNPGVCNRDVGQGIGVAHSGQVSRLLAQLSGMGLMANRSTGLGCPNVWRLTAAGELVAKALTRDSHERDAG